MAFFITKVQVFYLALKQRLMHVAQLTVPRFKSPLLISFQVFDPYIIHNDSLHQSVSVNAYPSLSLVEMLVLVGNVVFFHYLQTV